MRVPSVEPGVIPGRRRRWRIHADHLLGKTFPLLPPPYYKQTACNNPNCSGLWSLDPTVRKRKVRRKRRRTKEAGRYRRCRYYRWRQPWAIWQSVNVKSRTRTVGAVASTDDHSLARWRRRRRRRLLQIRPILLRPQEGGNRGLFDLPFNSFIFSGGEADLQKHLASRASLVVVVGILRCHCFFWGSSANVSPLGDLGKVLRGRSCRRRRRAAHPTRKGKKEGICKKEKDKEKKRKQVVCS